MSETRLRVSPPARPGGPSLRRAPSALQRVARHLVLRDLRALDGGQLTLREPGRGQDAVIRFGAPAADGLKAQLHVRSPAFWTRVAMGGSIGAAEAFVEELWASPDPTAVVRLVARNPAINRGLETGLAAWVQRTYRRWHDARDNSPEGSRTNIAAHYDLGNAFFERFLDRTMMYSSAVFPDPAASLATAQEAKLDLICRKLGLRPEHEVLEIGTGWGAFAIHAARTVGCRVHTTTISPAQRHEAARRIQEAGLSDRITLHSLDYRHLPAALGQGRFHRLVSIEMIEAVGEPYLDEYLGTCARMLRPDGLALLQAIVMSEAQYPLYRRGTDFIQRYIFPGSFLPSVLDLRRRLDGTTLRLAQLDDITSHYPPTLRAWARNVCHQYDALRAQGCSDDFLRLWHFYLAYCEGGFLERTIGDVHLLLAGPEAAMPGRLPVAAPFPDGMPPFVGQGGGTPPLDSGRGAPASAREIA